VTRLGFLGRLGAALAGGWTFLRGGDRSMAAATVPAGTLPTMLMGGGTFSGSYSLAADTMLGGTVLFLPGTTFNLNGHRLQLDASSIVWTAHGTPRPNGRWSEGAGAYVASDECWIAPMMLGDYAAHLYTGGTVPRNATLNRQAEVVNAAADIVLRGPGDVMVMPMSGPRPVGLPPAVTISDVRFENLGLAGNLGHYPFHFHLCGDAARGSTATDCVAVHSQNHAFVTHSSNGVRWTRCVAIDTHDVPFWWDHQAQPADHDLVYDHCLVVGAQPRVPNAGETTLQAQYRFTGFRLSGGYAPGTANGDVGTNLNAIGCRVAGLKGGVQHAGFVWPEADGAVWTMQDCLAHNIQHAGIFVWQNEGSSHNIERFVAYNCGDFGVDHGAYLNRYQYTGLVTADCPYGVNLHAMTGQGSNTSRDMVFEHTHLGFGTPMRLDKPTLKGKPTIVRHANYGPDRVVVVAQSAISDGTPNSIALRLVFQP
jgi:hypothetical protein